MVFIMSRLDALKDELKTQTPTADDLTTLGVQYHNATDGKTRDYEKANLCYQEALKLNPNHAHANYNLGLNHRYGQGVAKDLATAKAYYEKAEANGLANAKLRLLEMEMAETKPTPTADDWNALGLQYHNATDGKTRDYEKANLCYQEALKLNPNHAHANYNLGLNHRYGQGVAKDLATAKAYYEKAEANGLANAKLRLLEMEMAETKPTPTADDWNALGLQYHNATDGKTRDYEKANLCYQEALKLNPNHAHANYNLGLNHRYGQGVAKDLATAKAYYEKAEANGLANAKLRLLEMEMAETKPTPTADDWNALGLQYHNATDGKTRDYEKANLCYQEALKLNPNHAHANYNLGLNHRYGQGVAKDLATAKAYYEKAEANGLANAKLRLLEMEMAETKPTPTADDWNALGLQYHNATDGKTRDYEKANLCYQEALKLNPNHAHANYNLGLNHRYGQGVAKDLATAKAYYEKAEANGLANAKLRLLEMEMAETKPTPTADDWNALGLQYHNATDGKTRDYEKANLCYQEALKLNPNHAHANYNLGLNHRYGQGVAKDLATAKAYYEKAEANGLANAKLRLLEMEMAETKPTPTADDWNALGLQYHNATDGKTRDYEKANLCYQEALKLNPNHAHANYNLGLNHSYGQGVAKDLATAKAYYEKAEANGLANAKLRLLEMEMAETKPTPTADDWNALGLQYHNATDGKTRDYEKANLCYQEALKLNPNHAHANYNLGLNHRYGQGVAKDLATAKAYYEKAEANGLANAKLRLLEMEMAETKPTPTADDLT